MKQLSDQQGALPKESAAGYGNTGRSSKIDGFLQRDIEYFPLRFFAAAMARVSLMIISSAPDFVRQANIEWQQQLASAAENSGSVLDP